MYIFFEKLSLQIQVWNWAHIYPTALRRVQITSKTSTNITVVTRMDTPKYGETFKFVYIKYQPILVKCYQRFTKFNYGVTKTIHESWPFQAGA